MLVTTPAAATDSDGTNFLYLSTDRPLCNKPALEYFIIIANSHKNY